MSSSSAGVASPYATACSAKDDAVAQINMIATEGENKGKPAQGIYALDGDMLKICYTLPGKDRPTAFDSKPGSAATLVIWKRAKP